MKTFATFLKEDTDLGSPVAPEKITVGSEYLWKKGSDGDIVKVTAVNIPAKGKTVIEVEFVSNGEKGPTEARFMFPMKPIGIVNDYIKTLKMVRTARGYDEKDARKKNAASTYMAMKSYAQGIANAEVKRNDLLSTHKLVHFGYSE